MSDSIRSMHPPLIPLPSPTKQCDPTDPFDSLFSNPSPSQPLFVSTKSTERADQRTVPPTPPSAASDFGAFVSVPASMDPLQQPIDKVDAQTLFSPVSETPSSSEFFERFTVEAKERAGQNERRVLDELLEHEDDPLYWLKSTKPNQDKSSEEGVPTLIQVDEPVAPLSEDISYRHSTEHEKRTLPLPSDTPPSPPPTRQPSSPPLPSSLTSTLPRKWMSTILSSSIPPSARTAGHDRAASSPPHHRTDLPHPLTHSSPFAAHVFVPPTGAPGFAGDHRWNNGGFEFEERDEELRKVELVGRRGGTTPVLTNELADQLRTHLPALPRLSKSWSLLYSLDQHGVSLQTFYARCAVRVAGTLVVIRDSEDRVFGAWVGEQMRLLTGSYYGSGESFLWRGVSRRGQEQVEVFKWTGKNDYVTLCESAFISFGGGEGKYGLYLDANLIDGSSARCPTFDNAVLCTSTGHDESKTVPFECVGVEAWGVTS